MHSKELSLFYIKKCFSFISRTWLLMTIMYGVFWMLPTLTMAPYLGNLILKSQALFTDVPLNGKLKFYVLNIQIERELIELYHTFIYILNTK